VDRLPGRLWVHLDVDVLDEAVFPATDYLMPGGLGWPELTELLGPLLTSPSLAGVSVGCYNPTKDPDGAGGRALVDAFRSAMLR
jgi:arginase